MANKHVQTQSEWEEQMGDKIIDYLISEIYVDLRFLDVALSALQPIGQPGLIAFATEGTHLYYGPEHTLELFKKNDHFLMRAYLHSVLHCMYGHLWLKGNRVKEIWDVSCDIAVEYIIDALHKPCTNRALSWERQQFYEKMKEQHVVSAAGIYRMLSEQFLDVKTSLTKVDPQKLSEYYEIRNEFFTDDHHLWPDEEQKGQPQVVQQNQAQQKWQQISRQTQMQQEKGGKDPEKGEELLLSRLQAERGRRCYADFLKKFSVFREELHCDPDEYDLTYYTYGLSHYGNMPLIEPLETKESRKIQELIVVVDTSYSTSGDLVKNFLQETFMVLKQKNAFFNGCRLHVLQCDDQVQSDTEITNTEQLDQLMEHFTIQGGGNTDFRPAFRYVNQLIDEGRLKNPGGLLYFTDGQGTYPGKRPEYKTAFLFLEDYDENKVPPWAMRMKLEQEEFREVT